MIDLLLFDLGNTLLDYHKGPLNDREKDLLGLNKLHEFINENYGMIPFHDLYGRFFVQWEKDLKRRKSQAVEFDLVQYFQWCLPELNKTTIEEMMLAFSEPVHRFVESKGNICDALPVLKGKVSKIGIVSNSPIPGVCHLKALDLLKIRHYFDFTIFSYDVGVRKPSPDIFKIALQKVQCEPNNAMMIGDSLELDVRPAQEMGMTAIHFKETSGDKTTNSISNFHDLVSILERLGAS